jgi:hypothetical protein
LIAFTTGAIPESGCTMSFIVDDSPQREHSKLLAISASRHRETAEVDTTN